MTERKECGAEIIKEVYNHLQSGKMSSISTSIGDDGSVTEILITDNDFRAKVIVGRGNRKNWR